MQCYICKKEFKKIFYSENKKSWCKRCWNKEKDARYFIKHSHVNDENFLYFEMKKSIEYAKKVMKKAEKSLQKYEFDYYKAKFCFQEAEAYRLQFLTGDSVCFFEFRTRRDSKCKCSLHDCMLLYL